MHIFVYARDESSNWELILVTGFSRLGTIEIYQPVTMGTNNTQLLPCILNMVDLISLFVASPFWTARRWCALLRAAEVFACPARGSYPLLDLPQSQVVILDDWRPDHGALDVSSTLLWLESATLRINRPLNLYSDHLDFRPTQPTFLTCNWQSFFVPKGCWSESELLMLRSRLTIYRFQHRIENLKDIPACPCCFTMFILSGGKNVAKFLAAGFPSVELCADCT